MNIWRVFLFVALYVFIIAALTQVFAQEDESPWYINRGFYSGTHSLVFVQNDVGETDTYIEINGSAPQPGDWIGVFYDSTGTGVYACAGAKMFTDTTNFNLVAFGDDVQSTPNVKDGFSLGENFVWRWYSPLTGETTTMRAVMRQGDNAFQREGVSVLDSLVTGDGDDDGPPWDFRVTDRSHAIAIPLSANPAIQGSPLVAGDYVGVFFDREDGTLKCAGYVRWPAESVILTAYGDDILTPEKDGMNVGEVFKWKLWRRADRREFNATAEYDVITFPDDSLFVVNGQSGLTSLNSTTIVIPDSITIDVRHRFNEEQIRLRENYLMIGLPGASDVSLETSFFRANPIDDWVAFFDDGKRLYQPYTEATRDDFVFGPGIAFWVNSKFDFVIDSMRVAQVEITAEDYYAVELREGWNMISNPFISSFNWQEVQNKNGVIDEIYTFKKRYKGFRAETKFAPYIGYYFYNRLNLPYLKIPYVDDTPETSAPAARLDEEAKDAPRVTISVTEDGEPRTGVELLEPDAASAGLDDHDQFAPPDCFQRYRLAVRNERLSTDYKDLRVDARPPSAEGETYRLELRAPKNEPCRIVVERADAFADRRAALKIPATGETLDVREGAEIVFTPEQERVRLYVVVGSSAYVEQKLDALSIDGLRLYQNFPNPFNPATTVRYGVSTGGAAEIAVFNGLGETVERTVRSHDAPGYYEWRWNARNAAAGVYFCRIALAPDDGSASKIQTVKMTLLK